MTQPTYKNAFGISEMGHVTELLDPVNKKNSIFDRDGRNAKTKKRVCQIGRASNFEATDLVNHLSLGQVKM